MKRPVQTPLKTLVVSPLPGFPDRDGTPCPYPDLLRPPPVAGPKCVPTTTRCDSGSRSLPGTLSRDTETRERPDVVRSRVWNQFGIRPTTGPGRRPGRYKESFPLLPDTLQVKSKVELDGVSPSVSTIS